MFFIMFCHVSFAAETNTVTSTITGTNTITGTTTVDKTPPTANAPNIIINNNELIDTYISEFDKNFEIIEIHNRPLVFNYLKKYLSQS